MIAGRNKSANAPLPAAGSWPLDLEATLRLARHEAVSLAMSLFTDHDDEVDLSAALNHMKLTAFFVEAAIEARGPSTDASADSGVTSVDLYELNQALKSAHEDLDEALDQAMLGDDEVDLPQLFRRVGFAQNSVAEALLALQGRRAPSSENGGAK